ncbi:MAG TPA: undecaprenyl-diphosphate phosphatase [Gemmatimonadales bacterium]|nr:undecaprenyl-diphosphate phosphatase [Gemmatimonadales bacterium]
MTWWEAAVLGLVQGLTEFLPVSSSGHLVVAEAALGLRMPGVAFDVLLHVATLGAVVLLYHRRIGELLGGLWRTEGGAARSLGLLVIATVPAAAVGVLFRDLFERAFDSLRIVGVDFLVTGVVLWSTRRLGGGARSEPTPAGAGAIGLAQAVAIMPGISRSGSTVAAALWVGVAPSRAAEFSFLMAIPVIMGAAVLELPELSAPGAGTGAGALPLIWGAAAAFLSGIVAIKLLVRVLERGAFYRFAPYCWALGAATLAWSLLA